MDEVVAALLAVPMLLLGILTMVTVVEVADRREQLQTVAHRTAVSAADAVYADASPTEVRAGVAAAEAAALSAAMSCADAPTVTVEYFDRRQSDWMPPARYATNTVWVGTTPSLSRVRVAVECWLVPGPLAGMTPRITHRSELPLPSAPTQAPPAPATDPFGGLREER